MINHGNYEHLEYYRYLNCGYRLPLVGGTDKMYSNVPVGLYRTYAQVPDDEFTYESWCRAVRAGRTFLSGADDSLERERRELGDTLQLPRGGGTLEVEATAESIFLAQPGDPAAGTRRRREKDATGARRCI